MNPEMTKKMYTPFIPTPLAWRIQEFSGKKSGLPTTKCS